MFSAAAITNTGSALVSEIVGPAGSTSVGVFSRTYACAADELCPPPGLLLEDCAQAKEEEMPPSRHKKAAAAK
jgi:hypothetical protein